MKTLNIFLAIVLMACSISSCSHKEEKKSVSSHKNFRTSEHNLGGMKVDPEKITSKGIVEAFRTVPVFAEVEGVITDFNLVNGQSVTKGSVLLKIDDRNIKMEIERLNAQLEQCDMKLREKLIGLGYKHDGIDAAPADLMRQVRASTGYTETLVSLHNLKAHLNDYSVKAPISGKVIGINIDKYSYARNGEPLFYIIDTSRLLVKFSVLEANLSYFNVGDTISVSTIAYENETHNAVIRSIAPQVQENGMIEIEAVMNKHEHLVPGMSAVIDIDK